MSNPSASVEVPVYLPGILAFVCAIVAGLTSFGDAILWQCIWAALGAMGVVPGGRDSLKKAVLFITVMSISNLPISVIVSRKQLLACMPYGFTMATTGLSMVYLGAWLLFHADLDFLKIAIGTFFILFSVLRLTSSVATWGSQRQQNRLNKEAGETSKSQPLAASAAAASASLVTTDFSLSESYTPVYMTMGGVSPSAAATVDVLDASKHAGSGMRRRGSSFEAASGLPVPIPASNIATTDASATAGGGGSASVVGSKYPILGGLLSITRISPVYSVPKSLLLLFLTGTGSGLLGGMFGTGGPPQMISFSLMKIDKDDIRGVATTYAVLETVARIVVFTTSDGTVFQASEWPIYLSIAIAGIVGFLLGTYCRRFFDTAMIIRMLLVLVFASSAILLGALTSPGIAAGFGIGGAAWLALLCLAFFYPTKFLQMTTSLKKTACAVLRAVGFKQCGKPSPTLPATSASVEAEATGIVEASSPSVAPSNASASDPTVDGVSVNPAATAAGYSPSSSTGEFPPSASPSSSPTYGAMAHTNTNMSNNNNGHGLP